MVLYREQKRRSPWLWVGLAVAIVAVLAFVAVALSFLSRPSDDERLADSIRLMTAQLDVLTVSHYTQDTLSEGASDPEYEAAREDMRRISEEWGTVEELVDAQSAVDISEKIGDLSGSVDDLAPVSEIQQRADQLAESLNGLKPAR